MLLSTLHTPAAVFYRWTKADRTLPKFICRLNLKEDLFICWSYRLYQEHLEPQHFPVGGQEAKPSPQMHFL